MKNILFLLLALGTCTAEATIRRVGYNGAPVNGVDYTYIQLQDAFNNANPNDTIQVYQQLNATGIWSVEVNKPLIILGFGHTLDINTGYQVLNKKDTSTNQITHFKFGTGSAGSVIMGLNLYNMYIADSNITVSRCRFKGYHSLSPFTPCGLSNPLFFPADGGGILLEAYTQHLKNITINGCFFDRFNSSVISQAGGMMTTNLLITNNYFNGPVNLYTGVTGKIYGVFANNIMNMKYPHLYNIYYYNANVCTQGSFPNNASGLASAFDYFMIRNNIFNSDDTVTCIVYAPNSIIQNNIFSWSSAYTCSSAGGANNIFKANMSSVFTASWNNGYVLNDNQLALSASSVAINAGVRENGTPTNCGIYGGETGQQYRAGGIPPVPSVFLLSTPGIQATTNPFNVTLSVRSNN